MPSGVGPGIPPVRLGQHGDSVARVAQQIQPRWRGHERPFAAEGATVSRLGREGFGLLAHDGHVSTSQPCWHQSPASVSLAYEMSGSIST
jgi:hypothetical protein